MHLRTYPDKIQSKWKAFALALDFRIAQHGTIGQREAFHLAFISMGCCKSREISAPLPQGSRDNHAVQAEGRRACIPNGKRGTYVSDMQY